MTGASAGREPPRHDMAGPPHDDAREPSRDPSGLAPRSFFLRDVDVVARDLVGQLLAKDGVVLRVTECEAYGPVGDSAAHCRFGRTARTEPMWREGGRAYVYLCYGIHWMLNLVTGGDGDPRAVLVRSAEVVDGLDVVVARRGRKADAQLVAGPGKVAQALALDGGYNHHDLCAAGGLELRLDRPAARVLSGRRVGIDYAAPADRRARRRFALAGAAGVTARAALR